MTRSLLLGITSALAITQFAAAADLPAKAPALAAPAAIYNWSGIYVGGSAGGAWAHGSDWTFPFAPSVFAPAASAHSGTATLLVGVQWQWQNFVFGVEGNIYKYFNLNADSVCPSGNICELQAQQSWTVGPRLGWALNNWLLYGTGGWASTQLASPVFSPITHAQGDAGSDNHKGWFAGGGVEYALLPNVIVGVEYTHIHANQQRQLSPPITGDDRVVGMNIDTVRGRLSLKFNPF